MPTFSCSRYFLFTRVEEEEEEEEGTETETETETETRPDTEYALAYEEVLLPNAAPCYAKK